MSHKNICEFESSPNHDDERADDDNEQQLQILRSKETNQQTTVPTFIMESLQNQVANSLVSNSGTINVYSLNVGKLHFCFFPVGQFQNELLHRWIWCKARVAAASGPS